MPDPVQGTYNAPQNPLDGTQSMHVEKMMPANSGSWLHKYFEKYIYSSILIHKYICIYILIYTNTNTYSNNDSHHESC